MKRYLVTGGSGFLGHALISRLVKDDHKVVALARNEGKLIELQQKFPDIEIITGDIADPYTARLAVASVNGIFHLAGFKHVGQAEKQPKQCIQSNVSGSMVLLQAIDRRPYDFVIGISTDKAAQVAGIYGASKLLMEGLFRQFESHNPQTKYRIVRYGNVLYSTGSVLCKWKAALQKGEEVTITHPGATRFFWTVEQAVNHIFECLDNATDASPYIPYMNAISMRCLLEAMQKKYGKAKKVNTIGLQPGENMSETMNGVIWSQDVPQYTIDEILQLI
jgi:UDP-N-acetylglucosamine 4,6-dehydratase/5-epimerase